jgi:hypothetical protein
VVAGQARAHASEQGFVLLLPTHIYIIGGTLAVVASVLLVTVLSPHTLAAIFRPIPLGRGWNMRGILILSSLLSTACFISLIGIGLFGPTDPQANLLPLVIWSVIWVAVFVVQGSVFDLWAWLNPWVGLHRLMLGDAAPIYRLPSRLQAWPAVLVFLSFQVFAIADIAPSDPRRLANIAAGYWIFTFLGMVIFGRKAWLSQVECFSVLFDLIGRLRMIVWVPSIRIGVPGWQALQRLALDRSQAIFCLVVLGAGSFDGLHETFWWLAKIGINPLEFPGRSAVIWTSSVGVLAASAALVGVFAIAVWIGVKIVGNSDFVTFESAFNGFAISILPIALGYHFAHFLVSFLVQIQFVAVAFGDPIQQGWDLFGLGNLRVTTGFLKAADSVKIIWLTQAGAVVLSHVLSVIMAHHVAGALVKTRKNIVRLQLGISVLMIVYTVFGLWLLATARGM